MDEKEVPYEKTAKYLVIALNTKLYRRAEKKDQLISVKLNDNGLVNP